MSQIELNFDFQCKRNTFKMGSFWHSSTKVEECLHCGPGKVGPLCSSAPFSRLHRPIWLKFYMKVAQYVLHQFAKFHQISFSFARVALFRATPCQKSGANVTFRSLAVSYRICLILKDIRVMTTVFEEHLIKITVWVLTSFTVSHQQNGDFTWPKEEDKNSSPGEGMERKAPCARIPRKWGGLYFS